MLGTVSNRQGESSVSFVCKARERQRELEREREGARVTESRRRSRLETLTKRASWSARGFQIYMQKGLSLYHNHLFSLNTDKHKTHIHTHHTWG
jgi:hypothetical protein